ncbi:MAG: sigma-70 family RNA polymerase sigma factor [Saprospiraceae bacterium]|nr:sigma-70 family RNA polymerase sigma factor [Lewinella sp.]
MERKPETYTDEELVQLFQQQHNRKALGLLYRRYAHLVLGLCLDYLKNREDAKDAVMDIFEKAGRKLPEQSVTNFRPWLFYVSRNHCIDILRKKLKQVPVEFSEAIFMESAGEDRPIEENQIELLTAAIAALKPHQRDCITLFYLKGYSYEKVSKLTGFSDKEVKSYLQNGRRNLKIIINKLEHEQAE